ncbi:Hypothetical protein HDN1F_21920 [gamma proteobacterium HdN1]|nr:Hypothetical protein HDN1F_21920 [gamma proteobacterium HdN1]
MNTPLHPWSRPFSGDSGDDISAQFEGMEIEFNDKATLFPVQTESSETPRRNAHNRLRSSTHNDTRNNVMEFRTSASLQRSRRPI